MTIKQLLELTKSNIYLAKYMGKVKTIAEHRNQTTKSISSSRNCLQKYTTYFYSVASNFDDFR